MKRAIERSRLSVSQDTQDRDPFDRLLIAQAQVEQLSVFTADPTFNAYDVMVV
jgi:PIN domain nuclease of toxin-antitoxin system